MSEIDLDINNYGYDELLSLFKLKPNYGEKELKEAKQIVFKMHPDKSKLPPQYFLFFSKAFKTVLQIYEFKNKTEKTPANLKEYKEMIQIVPKKGDDNFRALKTFIETNDMNDPKKFNKWFNSQFEKAKEQEDSDGYGEWFKTEHSDANGSQGEVFDNNKVRTKEEIGKEFAKKKAELRSVVKYGGVQEMYASNLGSSILGESFGLEESGGYSSEMFGGLLYQDLKQAHTETVIPVSETDFDSVPKFKNVDDYQRHRDSDRDSLAPLSNKEANQMLSMKEKREEEEATKRAYYYAKQVEENEKKTNTFWSSLKQLTNL